MDEQRINTLINLLNEKEVLLKEREIALEDQQEEFLSQKEELNAAVEELISKNAYLVATLEKLKQRNQELDHILYRASHDLKTPVSSIYGLIEILRSGPLTADQQFATIHLLQQARQMEMRLVSLTNLATAFFTEPVSSAFSVHDLFSHAWKQTAATGLMKFHVTTDDLMIATDRSLLTIAVQCLLDNAIAYRDKEIHGNVFISCSEIPTGIQIEIADEGDGIDPRIENRIFEMFYRGSEKSKGLGLGLYIARTIVDKLRGTIDYIGCQPRTTFRLFLPQ